MPGVGFRELAVIFLIVLLLFGANRIPEIARAMGKGIRDFKRATKEVEEDLNLDDPPRVADKTRAETRKDSAR